MWARLGFAVVSMLLVAYFPATQPISFGFFLLIICSTVFASFAQFVTSIGECGKDEPLSSHADTYVLFARRTVQFVGISAFHTQIADPVIGGTYMTVRSCCSFSLYECVSLIDSSLCSCSTPSAT